MGISFDKPKIFTIVDIVPKIDWPWLWGTEGDDTLRSDSDPGDDIYFSILYGLEGRDHLIGGAQADELHGGEDDDRLEGNGGDDWLFGEEGDDTLIGGAGADHLIGGEGEDTASYADSSGGVVIDLALGGGYAGDAAGDRFDGVENIVGSAHRDVIFGDANDNWFRGRDGNDQLFGEGGDDWLWGEGGDDILEGGTGNDSLSGHAGNDRLNGSVGDDHLSGGADDDHLIGGFGDDELSGGEGADRLEGGDGIDTAFYHLDTSTEQITVDLGGTGAGGVAQGDTYSSIENGYIENGTSHTLIGDSRPNELTLGGNSGSRVEGGGGDDVIILAWSGGNDIDGGIGTDELVFHNGRDTDVDLASGWARQAGYADDAVAGIENVHASSGNDEVYGSNAANRLLGDMGADELYGRDGNDHLEGGIGNDRLDGGRHDDRLFGDEGDDWLNGNDGDDTLTGGQGGDTFVFITGANDPDQDIVTDYEVGIDQLDLTRTIIGSLGEFLGRTEQVGTDAVIDTGAGTITLENINMFDLTAQDFIF